MSHDGPFEPHSIRSADDTSARQNDNSDAETSPLSPVLRISSEEITALASQQEEPHPEAEDNAAAGLFRSWAESGYDPWPPADSLPRERIPNLGHMAVF